MANKCVFYCERDFYSTPQVLLITANDELEAKRLLDEQYEKDNYGGLKPKLKELNISENSVLILEPPGNRDYR
ncbi:MAG: hypothetical protein HYW79_00560 [Parcubacteria group bacterium]|nr:hypothetical protein [Parcubacteria group bacterium]